MQRPSCLRASSIVVHEGCVLLVAGKKAVGYWLPPGGRVELHERAEDAAAREALEETGVRVRATRLIAWREVWWDDADVLELYFGAELLGGDAGGDGADHGWKWLDVQGLSAMPVLPEELAELCDLATSTGERVVHLSLADLRGIGA